MSLRRIEEFLVGNQKTKVISHGLMDVCSFIEINQICETVREREPCPVNVVTRTVIPLWISDREEFYYQSESFPPSAGPLPSAPPLLPAH